MSEFHTKCSYCNSVFEVDEKYINQITECPDCGKEFVIQPQVQKGQDKPVKNPDNSLLLGLYEIKGEPVAGGMGKVFRVHHSTWNVDLAMKHPRPEFFETEEQKQNFIHECDAWINLGLHPNIVSCYYVRNFLVVRNGKWDEEDFKWLINDLQNSGYGWLRPEGVRKKLEEMARNI